MRQQIPISTTHLFPLVDEKLIALLRSLSPAEWNMPTLAKKWTVKDIAAHLLDGNLRMLSLARDQHLLPLTPPTNNYQELVHYLNELNAVWVSAAKRISPAVLVEWLEITGKQFSNYILILEPFETAIFPVSWAGEAISKNWFHIAREYTEKFHHQQQIREAVGQPGLMTKELFYPFIDTFMCGLPHTYRNTAAEKGTTIQVTVTTEAGGIWWLTRGEEKWGLSKQLTPSAAASVSIDPDTAWKLFSKGITAEEAKEKVTITGNKALALIALHMIAVMA